MAQPEQRDALLELAVNGGPNVIAIGHDDLLSLHPFRAIDILAPAAYRERAEP